MTENIPVTHIDGAIRPVVVRVLSENYITDKKGLYDAVVKRVWTDPASLKEAFKRKVPKNKLEVFDRITDHSDVAVVLQRRRKCVQEIEATMTRLQIQIGNKNLYSRVSIAFLEGNLKALLEEEIAPDYQSEFISAINSNQILKEFLPPRITAPTSSNLPKPINTEATTTHTTPLAPLSSQSAKSRSEKEPTMHNTTQEECIVYWIISLFVLLLFAIIISIQYQTYIGGSHVDKFLTWKASNCTLVSNKPIRQYYTYDTIYYYRQCFGIWKYHWNSN